MPQSHRAQVVVNPPAEQMSRVNTILWGRAKQYHVGDFPGPLSIKSVVRGSAMWSTSEAQRVVGTGHYLVLNAGQPYSITIDARETVETFCLFFRDGFVEGVARAERGQTEGLLEEPEQTERLEFFETLHSRDWELSPLLRRMHEAIAGRNATEEWLHEQFFAAARALVRVGNRMGDGARRIPARKASTRQELYRRLLRGKDYMDSFYDADARLEQIARVACVSPYHFHRLFRRVFRETPNQYLQRKRLANALELLKNSEQTVTDISLAVGFESSTSFSALFRRSFGCSPRQYRALSQNHKK